MESETLLRLVQLRLLYVFDASKSTDFHVTFIISPLHLSLLKGVNTIENTQNIAQVHVHNLAK